MEMAILDGYDPTSVARQATVLPINYRTKMAEIQGVDPSPFRGPSFQDWLSQPTTRISPLISIFIQR